MGDESGDAGYVERETRRLMASIAEAEKKEQESPTPLTRVVAVHFPPIYANEKPTAFLGPIEAYKPKVCVYGHLHAGGIPAGFTGEKAGIRYVLASCDAAGFSPLLLDE
ncbi:hypothetical protein ACN28S_61090 [Cystobacter fuscus]